MRSRRIRTLATPGIAEPLPGVVMPALYLVNFWSVWAETIAFYLYTIAPRTPAAFGVAPRPRASDAVRCSVDSAAIIDLAAWRAEHHR